MEPYAIRRLVLVYAGLALLWVVVSDEVVYMLHKPPEWMIVAQTYKGWAFVLVSAGFLWFLLRMENRQGRRKLELSENRFQSVVDSLEEYAVFLLDERGRIITWNVGAKRLYDLDEATAMGRGLEVLGEEESDGDTALLHEAVRQGWAEHIRRNQSDTGRAFTAQESIKPLKDEAGELSGYLVVARDVAGRQAATDALQESQRRMATLIANLPGMVYRCHNDPDWRMEFVSKGCRELTGYSPQDFTEGNRVAFGNLILPEDRERTWQVVQKAAQKKNNGSFEVDYRIRTADGTVKRCSEKGRVVHDRFRNINLLEGVIIDVTSQYEARQKLEESDGDGKSSDPAAE